MPPRVNSRQVFVSSSLARRAISPIQNKIGKALIEELWLILGDGVNQAADLALGATSIPSWNLTPWMTFGNWF
jgi:hypothetical protein